MKDILTSSEAKLLISCSSFCKKERTMSFTEFYMSVVKNSACICDKGVENILSICIYRMDCTTVKSNGLNDIYY